MAHLSEETVSESKYKELFNMYLLYLTNDLEHRMTIISKKSGIPYDRIVNIKKGKSSGNETLLRKLTNAYHLELNEKFKLPAGLIGELPEAAKKGGQPASDDRFDKLEEEVELLKKQNQEMMLALMKLQSKLIK